MDDSYESYDASIHVSDGTMTLTKDTDKNWKANFRFERVGPNQLTVDGTMDGHTLHMQLQLMDRNKFLIVSRGFHWIQEYPYNR